MEADITSQAVGLASSDDFSIINLFVRADIIVKSVIIITDFTIISALKKRFIKEKSALDARPTACVEISASILDSFHTQMCH